VDVPLGDLLLGLSCAALIGAAGGIVYGGILGPADKARGRTRTRRATFLRSVSRRFRGRRERTSAGIRAWWARRRDGAAPPTEGAGDPSDGPDAPTSETP
jgi:hypothetical protein